jgi:hypothetical protein
MLVLTATLAAACAGTLDPAPRPSPGYGARPDAVGQRADEHAKLAKSEGGTGGGYTCGDTVQSDQLTSGGQRIEQSVPCWDTGEDEIVHEDYMAQLGEENAEAKRTSDQQANAQVAVQEHQACDGLSQREQERSPFRHRHEIAEVIPHREADQLRGVRIVWKQVPGLTAAWMQQAIACHQARFERLGEPSVYLPEDPTLVAHANVTVEDHKGHLEVVVDTTDPTASQVALDRAQNLLHPKPTGPKTADR